MPKLLKKTKEGEGEPEIIDDFTQTHEFQRLMRARMNRILFEQELARQAGAPPEQLTLDAIDITILRESLAKLSTFDTLSDLPPKIREQLLKAVAYLAEGAKDQKRSIEDVIRESVQSIHDPRQKSETRKLVLEAFFQIYRSIQEDKDPASNKKKDARPDKVKKTK